MSKPLEGIRVLEFAGLGPAPHACMILADLGADVVRVERPGTPDTAAYHHTLRGRTITQADLKNTLDLHAVRQLITKADVLVEGFRPGVMERLELGPEHTAKLNPQLIYARMTGWGQNGPMAQRAGHDINYIGLTGALHAVGTSDQPIPPLNLVGDYGGGSMFLVVGVLSALLQRQRTGQGTTVDAAMVDGVSILLQQILEFQHKNLWQDTRSANVLDGAAPYYRTYRCADGGFVAVGAIEEPFYTQLLEGLELDATTLPDRDDQDCWPELTEIFTTTFAKQPRDHWAEIFADTDACVTPVLSFAEAPHHEHIAARKSLVHTDQGSLVATPAPRVGKASGLHHEQQTTSATLQQAVETWEGFGG